MPPQTIMDSLVVLGEAAGLHPTGNELKITPRKGEMTASNLDLFCHCNFLDDPGAFKPVATEERRQVDRIALREFPASKHLPQLPTVVMKVEPVVFPASCAHHAFHPVTEVFDELESIGSAPISRPQPDYDRACTCVDGCHPSNLCGALVMIVLVQADGVDPHILDRQREGSKGK